MAKICFGNNFIILTTIWSNILEPLLRQIKKYEKFVYSLLLSAFASVPSLAQITSSAISGKVIDSKNENLIGSTVVAINGSTGAKYITIVNADGRYTIPNMSSGGPYKVTVSFVGYRTIEQADVFLNLGITSKIDFTLQEESTSLSEVVVTGERAVEVKTGAVTNISKDQLQQLPTLARGITDFTRLTPQASNNSFAGTNFRYNNISIDGAINNDAIGFSPSLGGVGGTANMPGSSTRTNPISLDAIQEVSVQIAPYDVKLGNFTGGTINAVTRSGTNDVTGSVYFFGRNSALTGPNNAGDGSSIPSNYQDYQTGFRIGFPIIKNKLFLFTNMEIARRTEPVFYGVGSGGLIDEATAQSIITTLKNLPVSTLNPTGGYDPGTYKDYSIFANSNKFFVRLDYSINDKHKLTIRNNTIGSDATNLERAANLFKFSSQDFTQYNNLSTTVAELKSNFNSKFSNNLIVGYTDIKDYRTPQGTIFPQIQINNVNGGTVLLGTDREASVFNMRQKTLEITNNFNIYLGKHALTIGTHNELYNIQYGFVNSWNGRYDFNGLTNFSNYTASRVRAFYNLSDNSLSNNYNTPGAVFDVNMYSAYIQDEWSITDRLKLSPGIRFDMAQLPVNPQTSPQTLDATLNTDSNFGKTYTYQPINQTTNNLLGQVLFSPRLGFNYDVKGDGSLIVRGGTGAFTGRIPFAWLGYAYYNNGITYGAFDLNPPTTAQFNINRFPTDPTQFATYNSGRKQVDLVANNFKMPQVWRTSIATDIKLPSDYKLTLEAIYTQVINDVKFQMVNLRDDVKYSVLDVNQQQPIYQTGTNSAGVANTRRINDSFSNAHQLSNTDKGYRYQLTAQIQKNYKFGLNVMAAYTYGQSYDISNGIRNSMESNWQLNQSLVANNPSLAHSNFDIRSRIVSSIGYTKNWSEQNTTRLSLLFTSQSGSPFTYTYGSDVTGSGQQISLAYVPKPGEVTFVPSNAQDTRTPATIQQQFEDFVNGDDYLSKRRGNFTERNEGRTPWNTNLDLRVMHDFHFKAGSKLHTLQLTFDIINFTNLLNKEWGRSYFVPNTLNQSANVGWAPVGSILTSTTYTFTKPQATYSIDQLASRWQGQLGIRYIF